MSAGYRAAVGKLHGPLPGAWNPRFLQPFGDHLRAQLATRLLLFQKRGQRRVRNINIQPDNMNFVVFPQC